MKNIIPIRGKGTNCIQDLLITIATYWELNYELYFCENFVFSYNPKKLSFGERIGSSRNTSYDFAEKYNGIHRKCLNYSTSKEALVNIISSINEGEFAMIFLDAYFTPWHKSGSYHRVHADHYCLIVGVDLDKSILYTIDPVFSDKIEELSFDDFISGNNGEIDLFSKVQPTKCINSDKDEILERVKNSIIQSNNINDILKFREDFLNEFDIIIEASGKDSFGKTDIWRNLDKIIFGRYYFYQFIRFFSTYYAKLQNIEHLVLLSSRKWEMFRSIITKMYYSKKIEYRSIELIGTYLKEIYDYEKSIINFLNGYESTTIIKNENLTTNPLVSIDSLVKVSLKPHFNNKIFLVKEDSEKTDNKNMSSYIILEHMDIDRFDISSENKNYDNIKCENQLVNVDSNYYSHILLYGCSEFGGSQTKIRLIYENSVEDYDMYFSDWEEKDNDDLMVSIYWEGVSDKFTKKYIKQLVIPVRFSEKLTSIQLPFYPNLHLFSIKLNPKIIESN